MIEHPERITAQQISKEHNAEPRRVLLARFGERRYLEKIEAQRIHADHAGELYRAELSGDEHAEQGLPADRQQTAAATLTVPRG